MAGLVPFTDNYSDHSTDTGYQFEFFCERCGNGYKSPFQASAVGMGAKLARGLGGFLGGNIANVAYAGEHLKDMTNSAKKDEALREAVELVKPNFTQCHRCGNWVCKEICWNYDTNLCVTCSPKLSQEVGAIQSEAQLTQLREKATTTDYTAEVNLERKQVALCPHCGVETDASSKFCADCGKPLSPKKTCSKCGAEADADKKFCAECGNTL